MIENKRILAVIPARGGSKGLPGKNLRPVCGMPLIGWSIEAGRRSRYLDTLCVSTDSGEIASVASMFGVSVPWLRPAELATDTASSIDVVLHALEQTELREPPFDWVCLLEPTSPLRDESDIDAAIEMLAAHDQAEAVVGLCLSEGSHPEFQVKMKGGFLRCASEALTGHLRRQDLEEEIYFPEGSIYISVASVLRRRRSFYHERTLGYVVPRWKAVEVDELSDAICVEALLTAKRDGILR